MPLSRLGLDHGYSSFLDVGGRCKLALERLFFRAEGGLDLLVDRLEVDDLHAEVVGQHLGDRGFSRVAGAGDDAVLSLVTKLLHEHVLVPLVKSLEPELLLEERLDVE